MEKLQPYPVGAVVRYNGSWGLLDELYVITGHDPLAEVSWTPAELAKLAEHAVSLSQEYPDGVAYEIWQKGILRRFGNRGFSFSRVRRGSLTPTGEHEEAPDGN